MKILLVLVILIQEKNATLSKKKTKEICLFMTKPIVYNPVLIFYKNNYANPKIKVSIV